MAQPPASDRGPAEEPARDSRLPGGAGAPGSEPQAAGAADAGPGSAACPPRKDPAPDCGPAGRTATPGGAGAPSGAAGLGCEAGGPGGAGAPGDAAGLGGSAGAPGGSEADSRAAGGGRDPRLAGFGRGGAGDACPPGAALAAVVAELSGPGWRCAGADDDELTGLLGRWQALESWAAAGKLGVIRELLRRRARPGPRGMLPMHGDLPDQWHEGTAHEVSMALGISVPSADNLLGLAWDLRARLPGTGVALAAGVISALTARLISDELSVLGDERAAAAEKLVLDQLTALTTPGMAARLAAQAAVTVDPAGAAARREAAERERARVRFWRENGGACALAAYGLPTDAALAASAAIHTRALDYKTAKVRPGARMDQLRVLAFLDLLNGTTLPDRITQDHADTGTGAGAPGSPFGRPGRGRAGADCAGTSPPGPGDGVGDGPAPNRRPGGRDTA